jgi:peroxiredoxin
MKTGDTVADFELPDQTGTPRKLSALLSDGPVVLFFYPAAMTPGCTKEACHFRDLAAEFAAVGASRVGISVDPVQKQAKFADMQKFDYPLLSDTEVDTGQTHDLCHRHRSQSARRDLQRIQHGHSRRQSVRDAAGALLERPAVGVPPAAQRRGGEPGNQTQPGSTG